jgi:hypothetical protein
LEQTTLEAENVFRINYLDASNPEWPSNFGGVPGNRIKTAKKGVPPTSTPPTLVEQTLVEVPNLQSQ